jgi:hypothetical protein
VGKLGLEYNPLLFRIRLNRSKEVVRGTGEIFFSRMVTTTLDAVSWLIAALEEYTQ